MSGSLQHHLFQDAFISDFRQEHGWLITFKRNLNDWELDRYLSLLNSLSSTPSASSSSDCIIWKGKSKGTFSLKSCYSISTQVSSQNTLWPWKSIWKGMAPLKVKCFSWLVSKVTCLTQSNLQRRGNAAMQQLCTM